MAVGDRSLGDDGDLGRCIACRDCWSRTCACSEDLPFGSRGGLAVRHNFPLDGEYAFKVRLRRQIYDYIVGMGSPQQLELRIDGARVKRFTVGGEAKGTPGPLTWNGEIVGETEYELYMHAADAGLEVRVPVTAGVHQVIGVVRRQSLGAGRRHATAAGGFRPRLGRAVRRLCGGRRADDSRPVRSRRPGRHAEPPRGVFVPARRARRDGSGRVRAHASSPRWPAARIGGRRPAEEIETLLTFYRSGSQAAAASKRAFAVGDRAHARQLQLPVPHRARPGRCRCRRRVYRLSDLDLASRLSFFLWSSIPDEQLLTLASAAGCSQPAVLEQQVRRMLRRSALARAGGQLRRPVADDAQGGDVSAGPDLPFPEFDENLRDAFVKEAQLFVDSQLRADRSIVELVTADYSFLNERLARHYGVPDVYGERFRRVTFTDGVRGGVLGQGGVLMVTSYPDRTAPVVARLVGARQPARHAATAAAAATCRTSKRRGDDGRPRSMREQMEVHRSNPACAACHVRMDPLGFALENFDAIGTLAHDAAPASRSMRRRCSPTARRSTACAGVRAFVLERRDSMSRRSRRSC